MLLTWYQTVNPNRHHNHPATISSGIINPSRHLSSQNLNLLASTTAITCFSAICTHNHTLLRPLQPLLLLPPLPATSAAIYFCSCHLYSPIALSCNNYSHNRLLCSPLLLMLYFGSGTTVVVYMIWSLRWSVLHDIINFYHYCWTSCWCCGRSKHWRTWFSSLCPVDCLASFNTWFYHQLLQLMDDASLHLLVLCFWSLATISVHCRHWWCSVADLSLLSLFCSCWVLLKCDFLFGYLYLAASCYCLAVMSGAISISSSLVLSSWLSDNTTSVSLDTTSGPFGAPTVQISQDEYDNLCQLEFSQTGHSSTHTSSSGMNAYIVSPHRLWILYSGASSHIICIKDKFIFFTSFP